MAWLTGPFGPRPAAHFSPTLSLVGARVGLWIPAAINLSGAKNMGSVQLITTVIKFVVMAFMATVDLFYISSANFTPWNISGEAPSPRSAAASRLPCSATWAWKRVRWPPARYATPTE